MKEQNKNVNVFDLELMSICFFVFIQCLFSSVFSFFVQLSFDYMHLQKN